MSSYQLLGEEPISISPMPITAQTIESVQEYWVARCMQQAGITKFGTEFLTINEWIAIYHEARRFLGNPDRLLQRDIFALQNIVAKIKKIIVNNIRSKVKKLSVWRR